MFFGKEGLQPHRLNIRMIPEMTQNVTHMSSIIMSKDWLMAEDPNAIC